MPWSPRWSDVTTLAGYATPMMMSTVNYYMQYAQIAGLPRLTYYTANNRISRTVWHSKQAVTDVHRRTRTTSVKRLRRTTSCFHIVLSIQITGISQLSYFSVKIQHLNNKQTRFNHKTTGGRGT